MLKSPVLKLPRLEAACASCPCCWMPVLAMPALEEAQRLGPCCRYPCCSWYLSLMPKLPVPVLPMPMLPVPELNKLILLGPRVPAAEPLLVVAGEAEADALLPVLPKPRLCRRCCPSQHCCCRHFQGRGCGRDLGRPMSRKCR